MTIGNRIDFRVRRWAKTPFHDPESVLIQLRNLELSDDWAGLPEAIRTLRSGRLKEPREARVAALFAHGMAEVTKSKVYFVPGEGEDYDFVTAWQDGDERHFTPVQLKELPPEDLSPRASLQTVVRSLEKYAPSDTTLLIYLNRSSSIPLGDLDAVESPFAEVWFLWGGSEDQNRWFLWSRPLAANGPVKFAYPTGEPGSESSDYA